MEITQINIGDTLKNGDYGQITQAQIDRFANATGDHQWIHVDPERCKKFSPFKTTIAHGFLTLSLMPKWFAQVITVDPQTTTMINYGMDSLRFIEAVRVNDFLNYTFTLVSIENKINGKLYTFEGTALIKDRKKPALVGRFLTLVIS